MKNILNAIKLVFENKLNRIEKSIPSKLSDLDNDLFYSNATEQLHITLSDLTEEEGGGEIHYIYSSDRGFDYLKDPAKFKIVLSFSNSNGTHIYTQDDLTYDRDSYRYQFMGPVYIEFNSRDKTVWIYLSGLTSFDLRIWSIEDKIIPANVVEKMTGATSTEGGTGGIVPAPKAGQQDFVLYGDGKYKSPPQSDYTQNDEAATDYIKNRPFYTYTERRESIVLGVVPVEGTQRVNISEYDDNFWLNASKKNSISLKVHTSDVDVKEVILQKRYAPSYVLSGYSTDYWGNGSLITGSLSNTGEDIAIFYAGDDRNTILDGDRIGVWMRNYPVGQHIELTVNQDVELVKTIDAKYLPNTLATTQYVDNSIAPFQSTNNKVTSISSESTHLQYPTAKATYDAIQNNKTLFVNVDITQGIITADKTFAEMKSAIDNNSNIILINDPHIYILSNISSNTISFTYSLYAHHSGRYEIYVLTCNIANSWTKDTKYLQSTSMMSSSIYNDIREEYYPSVKAVYDAIQAAKPEIVTPTAESTATQAASAKAVWDSLPTLKTWTSADIATEGETT